MVPVYFTGRQLPKVAQPLESPKNILNYAFYITLGSSIVVLALVPFAFIRPKEKAYLAGRAEIKYCPALVLNPNHWHYRGDTGRRHRVLLLP